MRRFGLITSLAVIPAVFATLAAGVASAGPSGTSGNFPGQIALPDGFAPEGITTGRGTTVFVGSLQGGAIWRGDVRTGEGQVLADGTAGQVAVGLDFDTHRNVLWVAGGPTGEVRAHAADTGDLLATYTFPGAGFLNDVVVTPHAVYVTDSMVQRLAVIPLPASGGLPPASAARTLSISGDLIYQPGFNANGIVAARGWLVLVQSNTGGLFRVDPATGASHEIDLGGQLVTAGDGLELLGSTLYVVRNQLNQIDTVHLGARLESGTVGRQYADPTFDIPTTSTVAAGRLWAVNARFGTPPTPSTAYWITQVPLRR